jgi:hypothetical protein
MGKRAIGMMVVAVGLASVASAQEADGGERPAPERREIRVLEHPYDIASFYRSGGRPYFTYGGIPVEGGFYESLRRRHAGGVASFYRLGAAGRYSQFWQSGYGARPLIAPGRYGPAYRETIGENGDLYLFVPFLAPMGPLAGAYYR